MSNRLARFEGDGWANWSALAKALGDGGDFVAFRGDGELIRSLLGYGAYPDGTSVAGKSPREVPPIFDMR